MTYDDVELFLAAFKEWLAKGTERCPKLYAPFEKQLDQKSKGAMVEVEEEWDGREE